MNEMTAMDDQLDHAVRSVLADIIDTAPVPAEQPARVFSLDPPRRSGHGLLLGAAAAALVAVGVGTVVLLTNGGDDEATMPEGQPVATPAPSPTSVATPESVPSTGPLACSEDGCTPFDPMAVAQGATDFYVGSADLGTPTIHLDWFDSLTRCVELSEDYTTCAKIEGIAGVNLVGHATADGEVAIGTTFTDLTPTDYANTWGPPQSDPTIGQEPARVRGHDAIRHLTDTGPAVVWQERPGVLVWVVVPAGSDLDPVVVAEGVQLVDGPATIPHRVVVPALSRPWDAQDNDSDGLVVATSNGEECVGLNYVETCGAEMNARTIVRVGSDGATAVAGSATAEVTKVRIGITGGAPIEVETITFANYPSRYYSTVVASGAVESITCLAADGSVVADMAVTATPPDADLGGTSPPGAATIPTAPPDSRSDS